MAHREHLRPCRPRWLHAPPLPGDGQACGRWLQTRVQAGAAGAQWGREISWGLVPRGSHQLSLLSLRRQSGITEACHLGKWGASPYFAGGETEAGRNHCPQLPVDLRDRVGDHTAQCWSPFSQPQIIPDFPWGLPSVGGSLGHEASASVASGSSTHQSQPPW